MRLDVRSSKAKLSSHGMLELTLGKTTERLRLLPPHPGASCWSTPLVCARKRQFLRSTLCIASIAASPRPDSRRMDAGHKEGPDRSSAAESSVPITPSREDRETSRKAHAKQKVKCATKPTKTYPAEKIKAVAKAEVRESPSIQSAQAHAHSESSEIASALCVVCELTGWG